MSKKQTKATIAMCMFGIWP